MFKINKALFIFLFVPMLAHAECNSHSDCNYYRNDCNNARNDDSNSSDAPEAHYNYFGLKGGTQSFTSNASSVSVGTTAPESGIYAGVRVNKNLAFEVEAINAEKFSTTTGTAKTSTYSLSGLNQLSLGYLDLFVRLGLSSTTAYVTSTSTGASSSNNLLGLSYGVGMEVALGKNAGLRVMYDRYRLTLQDNLNSDILSTGISYRF